MSALTSNKLIQSIKRRALIPTSQNTFSDEDFLAMANEEMNIGLVPSVMQQKQDYLLISEVIPLQSNTSRYKIPYRAIGNILKDVFYKDTSSNYFEMSRIDKSDLPEFAGPYTLSNHRLFYIEDNDVVMYPNVQGTVSGFLEMSYYIRPNDLVSENRVGVITAINTTTGEVTLSSLPSVFNLNELFDFIQEKSPHGILGFDVAPISINSTTKTLTFDPNNLPTDLSVGDHVALAGETMLPQLPDDLHVVLAHRVATRCLEALGDTQGLQNANDKLKEMESKTTTLINNRVQEAPKKILNGNTTIRRGLTARRFNRR